MNTLILCDRESVDFESLNLLALTEALVKNAGSEVKTVVLNGDEIKPCLGCFGCWVKTPGLCVLTSDCANEVSGCEMRADAVILLSRITYGGYSHDIKAFLDRSIPNISPMFEIYRGEMHHKMRYERFPHWIAVGYGEATPKERQTFADLAERHALNMRPLRHFVFTVQNRREFDAVMSSLEKVFTTEVRS